MDDLIQFNIEIADLFVKVSTRFEGNRRFCRDYLASFSKADIEVLVSDEEIDAEDAVFEGTRSREYCENVCIYRAIAKKLPAFDRFVLHGAAISVNGKGFVFTAPSGTGKTTHVSLLKKRYGDEIEVINGDKPIIGVSDGVTVYSCPWAGKEGWKSNISAPLEAIIILTRGESNNIKKIEPSEYFNALIKQIYAPDDGEMLLETLRLVDELAKKVDFYLLECNMWDDAADVSYKIMSKRK